MVAWSLIAIWRIGDMFRVSWSVEVAGARAFFSLADLPPTLMEDAGPSGNYIKGRWAGTRAVTVYLTNELGG